MEVLLLAIMGICNVACFIIGAKVGQTVVRGERLEVPTVDPFRGFREREGKKQAEAEQERIMTMFENIENYDGTGRGQKDVPRG